MDYSALGAPLNVLALLALFLVGGFMLTVYEAAREARTYYRRLNAEHEQQTSRRSVPQS